ncbi:PRC-barrel domain-containing protein [Devosia sp.]|uniref:PRC-barrel domain-containing protein n=1 Tax=Devosia sp. TaxID=1871048 RepID=UPI003BAC7A1C
MLKTLMTTTALVAMLAASSAIAQDAAPAPATDTPAATAPATDATAVSAPTSILASGYTVTDKDNLATEIIGHQVYSSAAADAEHIGDVNNLVVGTNGEIAAVIIGVGGFLGIGEKNVAVNYSELQWVTAEDNTERFVLPTTKEALEAAPDFKTTDAQAPVDATNPPPADNTMAPADNNTMAPADPAVPAPATN